MKNKIGSVILAVILGGGIIALSAFAVFLHFTEKIPELSSGEKMEEKKMESTSQVTSEESDTIMMQHEDFSIEGVLSSPESEKKEEEQNEEENLSEAEEETEEEETPKEESYIWKDASKVRLTDDNYSQIMYEIEENFKDSLPEGKSFERMIINEIYAKHGAKFKTKEIQDFFNQKKWYKKIKKKITTDAAYKKMSKLEQDNVQFLKDKED